MNEFFKGLIQKFNAGRLTDSGAEAGNSQTREVSTPSMREAAASKLPVMDSMSCPYCLSNNFQKRGFRQKKHERAQLYLCLDCRKTFTPQITKGKHYPLAVMLDAISIYNLGYSLEETCRIVNFRANKKAPVSGSFYRRDHVSSVPNSQKQNNMIINSCQVAESGGHDPQSGASQTEVAIRHFPDLRDSLSIHKTSITDKTMNLQPSTVADWVAETEPLCRYCQMRPYITPKYSPKDVVIHATLAHRQLYRYLYHRGKCELLINHEYRHRRFNPLREFLEMVPGECPHQYFQEGLRASETPLTFSKTAMIVRGKQNFATRLAEFVLQSVKDRRLRHQALQKFMLANDSVTVATEVPVYIMRDDIEHMKTQLGFEIYDKDQFSVLGSRLSDSSLPVISPSVQKTDKQKTDEPESENGQLKTDNRIILPRLITGHIDILQIRNGMVHILDYKPRAEKERPIEQLTLYAMALSRLTGLRLFEFKCAWFDEKDYFEFYPLHVLHKPKRAQRRRKVNTQEGTYLVNKDEKKIMNVRPI